MKTDDQIMSIIKGATSLQDALQKMYGGNDKIRETDLFNAVKCYFGKIRRGNVFEVHGRKGIVKNADTESYCEISDLFIISYSRHLPPHIMLPHMKINFLQAKKAELDNPAYGLITSQPDNEKKFKFHLSAVQYKLLKDCPEIDPLKTGLPANVLLDSCSPAITSYGVFYKDPLTKQIDIAFEMTQLLRIVLSDDNAPKSSSRTCYFDSLKTLYGYYRWRRAISGKDCNCGKCWHPYCHLCCSELLSTLHAQDFEDALCSYRIGSPVCGQMAADIAKAVIDIYLPKAENGTDFKEFAREYLNMDAQDGQRNNGEDRPFEVNEMFGEFGAPKYLLLVNVDEAKRRQYKE